ncbi:hypothetical protein BV20DRAFT_680872 [Pilatotrama ljubarskyi]|nr:hypothetical protein BV20DRAFT_680872 [Pilatotrama ljubarskyi]
MRPVRAVLTATFTSAKWLRARPSDLHGRTSQLPRPEVRDRYDPSVHRGFIEGSNDDRVRRGRRALRRHRPPDSGCGRQLRTALSPVDTLESRRRRLIRRRSHWTPLGPMHATLDSY